MGKVSRFTVSLDSDLLDRFDRQIADEGYPTRSKAVADLIRAGLVDREWESDSDVAAAIILVYDHHRQGLSNRLTHAQHDCHDLIISAQHIHLDHDNCLEIVAVRGDPERIRNLYRKLRGTKGVKYGSLAAASTGKTL